MRERVGESVRGFDHEFPETGVERRIAEGFRLLDDLVLACKIDRSCGTHSVASGEKVADGVALTIG